MTPQGPAIRSGARLAVHMGAGLRDLLGLIATPLVPADYLDMIDPMRAGADLHGRLVAKHRETSDTVSLVIRPGRSWRRHVPGQYVRLGVRVNGVRHWRAYSATSAVDDPFLRVTVKAMPDGVVSNHLVHRAEPGELFMLDQATGDFILPTPAPASVLFLTAGSGITPVMGILRNRPDALADVVVLHSAPTPAAVVFAAELRQAHAAGRLRLIERHTATSGLLSLPELDLLVPDWRDRHTWACGPTGLLDDAERHWQEAGLTHLLHVERFRPRVHVAGDGGPVTFSASERTITTDGTRPLLDEAEDAGLLMPSGCRMGICFGCVLPLTEGSVRDLRNGALTTAAEGERIPVQTCVSAAAGACRIDH